MSDFKFYKTGPLWKILLWLILSVILFPMIPKSWNSIIIYFSRIGLLIKWRPFIYVILNTIIISILISSSSLTHKLNNLLQKVHKKSSHHNISSLISQTSQKLLHPFDDDTWWSRTVHHEDDQEVEKTVSYEPGRVEKEHGDDHVHSQAHTSVVEEVDTMEDTWKAIMEAKNKESGPHLMKSGTWTAGDRGDGNGGGVGGGKGRLTKYKVELKKWSTFSRDNNVGVKETYASRGGGGDGGGGGGRKGVEVGLTYHDELKKRADAFIARVTRDMRLQRMESDQRLLNTINRTKDLII